METQIRLAIISISTLSLLLTVAPIEENIAEERFKLTIEKVLVNILQPNYAMYNVTVFPNSTFNVYLDVLKAFHPMIFIKVNMFRKGKEANLVSENVDFCNMMNPPLPVSVLIKYIVDRGTHNRLKCPVKVSYYVIESCYLPASRFLKILPPLPYELILDVSDKKTGKLVSKNKIQGKIIHKK